MGRTIVETIVRDGIHNVVILARTANPEKEAEIGARITSVDYSDINQLRSTLETFSISTVISTLTSSLGIESELNLIQAASKSVVTRRYIANVWGITYTPEESKVFLAAEGKVLAMQALEGSSLEWTCFLNGFLSDYFVMPRGKSHMTPIVVLVDMMHNTATVPGSGSVPVVLAYSFDIAKFVVKALGLDHWEKEMYVVGDRLTLTEVVALAEKTKEAKFSVTHDSMGNLQAGEVCELPAHKVYYPHFPKDQLQGLLAFFGIIWELGKCNLKPDNPLNQRFPEIETATVGPLFQSAWGQD
ncbi:nmra-like family protein [Colletotrichum limetticola]|uniref:Nmra-like family protein n=1 Tax=Colletotrichum limetticola TaxID=1209924 RepID=A0ABQ9QDJ4_9PEZI|nr:nmra-like family protein [Colletotrichum limetticola]